MERIPGLDAWLTRGPDEQEHDKRCPLSDDYVCEACAESSQMCEDCDDGTHECICAELEADDKADAAQAKIDAWKEREIWGD